MHMPLEPKLADLLIRLTELDSGEYVTFHPYFSGESGPEAELIGFDNELIPEGPTQELARRGYLEMESEQGKRLGRFRISEQGRALAAQLAIVGVDAVDLSWVAVEPILEQIHRLWRSDGAPTLGLSGAAIVDVLNPPMEATHFASVLYELQRSDWVEFRAGLGPALPQGVRPTPRAVAYLEGWPTDDAKALGEQFVARLEQVIDAEPDEAKRSKLKEGFAAGGATLRDLFVEVAGATLARQVGD